MVEILLTFNTADVDNAIVLKSSIQRKLDINVLLQGDIEDEDLDTMVEEATVLLVFEFDGSSISAWITIDGVDSISDSNYEESPFPESIDCSKDVSKAINVLDSILYNDFDLDLRPPSDDDYKLDSSYQQAPLKSTESSIHASSFGGQLPSPPASPFDPGARAA